jgi:O-antigen ligase
MVPPRSADAVTLLTAYVFLIMIIPSSLVVLCWYVVARRHPAMPLDRGPQPIRLVAIFFGCALLAAYVSANRVAMPVLQESGADRGLISLFGWLGVVLLAADGIARVERLATLLRRIVLGATAMSVLGIAEFLTGVDATKYIVIPGLSVHAQITDLTSREGLIRAAATAAHPLEFAAVLGMSLPLAIHQARFAPAPLRLRRWLQVVLIVAAMPMTVSRSAVFELLVIGMVLFPTWPRRDRRVAYLVLLESLAALWLAKPSVLSGFGTLFGQIGTDSSSASRTRAYSAAAPYVAQHPWLGSGFETFFPQTYFFVDNQYLTSLIETGVAGLLALLALFVTAWFTARSARVAAADPQSRDLAQCLAASVVAAAVSFAFFDALSFSIASGMCFLLLGCVGAAWRLARAQ